MKIKKILTIPWSLAGIVLLLLVWELVSRFFASDLIFPGPVPVLKSFIKFAGEPKFFSSLIFTFIRVLSGMIISVPLGLIFGIAAGLDKRISAFFKPLFSLISATPVMSVILIAFLFLGAERTPVFTAFLMVFPVMAANAAEGIQRVDPHFIELFKIFRMSGRETLGCLYVPSIAPFIFGGLKSSLSLSWKVVVAAEVLVQPFRSLGTEMQQAKARLETPELFAWTLVTVAAAALVQFLLGLLLKYLGRRDRGRRG